MGPTDLAPADEPSASAIFSSRELYKNTRASGTSTSTPSRVPSTEKPLATSQSVEDFQSSSAVVTRRPSPSTLLDGKISAATGLWPNPLASAKKIAGELDKDQTFIAACTFLTIYQVLLTVYIQSNHSYK